MVEAIVATVGLIGGFLIALGWYKRGSMEMEKEINSIKERLWTVEKEGHNTYTDVKLINQRIGFMELKINEIHDAILKPRT